MANNIATLMAAIAANKKPGFVYPERVEPSMPSELTSTKALKPSDQSLLQLRPPQRLHRDGVGPQTNPETPTCFHHDGMQHAVTPIPKDIIDALAHWVLATPHEHSAFDLDVLITDIECCIHGPESEKVLPWKDGATNLPLPFSNDLAAALANHGVRVMTPEELSHATKVS